MKVAILTWDLNISGGTQRQALELACHMSSMGHDVTIYTFFYNKQKCYPSLVEKASIKYVHDDLSQEPPKMRPILLKQFFLKLMPYWIAIWKNEQLYRAFECVIDDKVDLLCAHDYGVYPVAVKYKKKKNVPVVWQMNDIPIRDIGMGWRRLFKLVGGFISGETAYNHIQQNYVKTIDKVVVIDNLNRNKLKALLNVDSVVIRNGVDAESFPCTVRTRTNSGFKIMANGIFFPWRRLEDLVEALRIVKEKGVKFEVNHVGTDARCKWYAEKIYRLVEENGLTQQIKFHGHVSEESLVRLYLSSDAFVFPNHPQTWGLAVFEAMACGTPVIVTTGCGASEVLTQNENAIIVDPESPRMIASAIVKLNEDVSLWNKLSKNGRTFVETNIRWDLYAQNMLNVFTDVMPGKR